MADMREASPALEGNEAVGNHNEVVASAASLARSEAAGIRTEASVGTEVRTEAVEIRSADEHQTDVPIHLVDGGGDDRRPKDRDYHQNLDCKDCTGFDFDRPEYQLGNLVGSLAA